VTIVDNGMITVATIMTTALDKGHTESGPPVIFGLWTASVLPVKDGNLYFYAQFL
jgi:hypothetical protein